MSFSFRNCTVSKSFAHRRKVKTLAVKNPTCSTWHCSVCLAFALFIVPLIQEWKYRKKEKWGILLDHQIIFLWLQCVKVFFAKKLLAHSRHVFMVVHYWWLRCAPKEVEEGGRCIFFDPPLGCIGDKFPATSEINFHPLWTSQQPHSCTLLTGFVAILAFSLRTFKFQTLHGQFEMVRAFMEPVNKPSWVAQAQQHINTQKPILMRLLWQASVVTHVTDGYFLLIELLKRVSSLCLKTLSQVMFDRGKFPPILALTELLSQLSSKSSD